MSWRRPASDIVGFKTWCTLFGGLGIPKVQCFPSCDIESHFFPLSHAGPIPAAGVPRCATCHPRPLPAQHPENLGATDAQAGFGVHLLQVCDALSVRSPPPSSSTAFLKPTSSQNPLGFFANRGMFI